MNPRLSAAAVLLLAGSLTVFGQPGGAPAGSAFAQPVIDAENAWAAGYQGCKPDALASLTTDDFTFTDFNGMTYTRVWFLKNAKGCPHSLVRIEPMLVSLNDGDKTAIVISKLHQFVGDTPVEIRHLTHVLVQDNGTWRVAHHHSTVMNDKIGPAGDQYGLPNGGKAFTQLKGGPSSRTPEAFAPVIARSAVEPSRGAVADRVGLEKQVVDAAQTYGDALQNCKTKVMDRMLTKDFVISGYNGMTYTRPWLVSVTEDCYHDLQRIEPLQLRFYGDNTAILLARYHQFARNKPLDYRHLTQVWIREGGAWKLALHHSTTFNERVGSAEGKLFYSEAANSSLNQMLMPNLVHVQ